MAPLPTEHLLTLMECCVRVTRFQRQWNTLRRSTTSVVLSTDYWLKFAKEQHFVEPPRRDGRNAARQPQRRKTSPARRRLGYIITPWHADCMVAVSFTCSKAFKGLPTAWAGKSSYTTDHWDHGSIFVHTAQLPQSTLFFQHLGGQNFLDENEPPMKLQYNRVIACRSKLFKGQG